MNVKEHVLLTGAGFTRNFGAPLAAEVWALIFSHLDVRHQSKLRELLLKKFEFEDVYHEVMGSGFRRDEKEAMRKAVSDAYEYIDSIVRNYRTNKNSPDQYQLNSFLNAFAGSKGKPGFIFTLNQDLFLERQLWNDTRPTMPYIPVGSDWFRDYHKTSPIDNQAVLSDDLLPCMAGVGREAFYYIKLHGSCNWYQSSGTRLMVIGRAKEERIAADRLLALYLDLFRKVLTAGAKHLLCIGYSFRDPHINDVLADAVDAGVEIFILGPGSPQKTAQHLKECHRGQDIWRGLAGYFPFDLITLFPFDQRKTEEWQLVSYQFFGRQIG